MSALRSYHQFLGNGIDALLIGPTGGMISAAAEGLDRCYWYKSDLYYADARRFQPGDDPTAFIATPPGGTNYQLAPLGRAWFDLLDAAGEPLRFLDSEQHFSPGAGVLWTQARYEGVVVEVHTWLAPDRPALRFEVCAPEEVGVRAQVAPGLWPEDREQTEPVSGVWTLADGWQFMVGAETCLFHLAPGDAGGATSSVSGREPGRIGMRGRRLCWWAVLESTRYPRELDTAARLPAYPDFSAPEPPAKLEVPDADYQRLHAFSMYMFQAMQHRESGGLPVNNLRRTFNSHVFWDGAFVQRALLEAGHLQPAREAWRFLARTREAAAANARAVFAAPGLHWDWETTHRGERAYLPWLQQHYQVHNTPILAHMVMADYEACRDLAVLQEGYDLLAGAATFLLHAVLVEQGDRVVTRPLVGSHEAPEAVVNDGATVAASLRLLRDVVLASHLLGRDRAFGRRCAVAARGLERTLATLFNGRYFQASSDEDRLNTSSLAPIYPDDVIAPADPRAIATAAAYRARYAGRMVGHGNNEMGFPWSAGVLARILAYQGQAGAAWEQLDLARVALCRQGGCAEYVEPDGRWNLQYFSTAQAALCSALHALVLQRHGSELRFFPALPSTWDACAFHDFLAAGLRIDARYDAGTALVVVRNERLVHWHGVLRLGRARRKATLPPGEHLECRLEDRGE